MSHTRGTYWVLQLIGWSLYFWSQASGEVIFASKPWGHSGFLWAGVCLTGIALTHAVRWISKRFDWLSLPSGALLSRTVAAVIVMSLLLNFQTMALSIAFYGSSVTPIAAALYAKLGQHDRLFNQYVGSLIPILLWTALYFGFVLQRRRFRAELRQAQLSEALKISELRLLKAQLNPHFLFNALNGVRALIADEPARAQDAVTHLARALRYSLTSGDEDLVSLARELEMVDDYLALESLRLAQRLQVERVIEPAAVRARVPVMLLQSLVENAIKHGIAPAKQGGVLRIAARIEGGSLCVEVENSRSPIDPGTMVSSGLGLRNSIERLRLLYGDTASLELDLSIPTRATARVRLPA